MKKDFSSIVGNDRLCDYFSSAIRKNKLSHAYILSGPRGCGKHTLAYAIAAAVSCENKNDAIPCEACNSCQKILKKISTDVVLVSIPKGKSSIGVDDIREKIKNDIITYPNDGDHKFYIIEDAHTMTPAAQNALLLSLEEPPEYAVFILLCESLDNVLETIKSRAPVLRMNMLSDEQIIEHLNKNSSVAKSFMHNSPSEFSQLLQSANGNLGYILELIEGKEKENILQNRAFISSFITSLADRSFSSSFTDLPSSFSSKRDDACEQLALIELAIRDLMVIKKSDFAKLLFFTDKEIAYELSLSFSLKELNTILDSAENARDALMRNSNLKLTILNFLTSLL